MLGSELPSMACPASMASRLMEQTGPSIRLPYTYMYTVYLPAAQALDRAGQSVRPGLVSLLLLLWKKKTCSGKDSKI